MGSVGARTISALVLTAIICLVAWLFPNMSPEQLGATTPDRAVLMVLGFVLVFYVYLIIQGYPISHGHIGDSSAHNWDNIISGVPAIGALFVIVLNLLGFWKTSFLIQMLAVMTMAVVVFDLWIIGGAASKINRLTDEFKSEK